MFKNVPHVKTKCGNKNASETFAEREQSRDYLSSFSLLPLNKLPRKPILVRKSLFHLF